MPLGEEDDSEVTGLGTLIAPVWAPCDSSARPGRDQGWGEVREILFKDRVGLQQAAWLAGDPAYHSHIKAPVQTHGLLYTVKILCLYKL